LLLLGTGIAAALIALEHIRVSRTDWTLVAVGLGAAVVLLTAALWHLRRAPSPLVRLSVLRVRTLRITVSGGSLYRLVITTVPFLL
ncbi:MFS transporter, partial [Mycobacterium sp. ITM-2017-0098]